MAVGRERNGISGRLWGTGCFFFWRRLLVVIDEGTRIQEKKKKKIFILITVPLAGVWIYLNRQTHL